jgi:hypothetical protein
MKAGTTVGLITLLLGYSVAYYGITQVQHGNWGYLDLLLPSRWPAKASVPRDSGSPAAGSTSAGSAASSALSAAEKANPLYWLNKYNNLFGLP